MTPKSIFILGRQPAIGRAELESILGAAHVEPAGENAASDVPPGEIPFARLGSSIKLASVVETVPSADWRTVQAALTRAAQALANDVAEGKIQLGLSAYGVRTNPRQLLAAGLQIKKALRAHNYSLRLTPNQELALSSAQVLHNHLTGPRGIELLAVANGPHTIIARTVAVQDITAYAARDQNRPKRDAFVGMLPPKLAQTIINLAAGPLPPGEPEPVVLDPFCGTGVILQEAALMGFGMYGTDLQPRMVDYAQQNLQWLAEKASFNSPLLEVGDATTHRWTAPFSAVASETYLGRPLSSWPNGAVLQEIIGTCNLLLTKFLQNIHGQTAPGTRFCLAVPAWRAPNGHTHHLPLLDRLGSLGYNRISFKHARREELLYFREGQLVARELLIITRN